MSRKRHRQETALGVQPALFGSINQGSFITSGELDLKTNESQRLYQAMINIFEDLSVERKGNVDTQKAMINILEDLQREVVAKNKFLAILSHELRNPLAPITSTLEYMKLVGLEYGPHKESIEIIEHQFEILSKLLKDLLDVARISSNKLQLNFEEVCLHSIINHAVDSTRPFMQKAGHSFSVSLPKKSIRLVADPLRLEQILVNLLSNAIKYTGPDGLIRLTAYHDKDKVIIEIKDTGIGIDPKMLSQIFNLFTQQEDSSVRVVDGLGIGLALVRSLVELHGGLVYASSKGVGKGSIFKVQLPLIPPRYAQKITGVVINKVTNP